MNNLVVSSCWLGLIHGITMKEFWVRRCWAGGILWNEGTRCPPEEELVKCLRSGWLSVFSSSKKTNPLLQQCIVQHIVPVLEKKPKNFAVKVQEKRDALCSQHYFQPSCCAWGTSLGLQASSPQPQQHFPCR